MSQKKDTEKEEYLFWRTKKKNGNYLLKYVFKQIAGTFLWGKKLNS